MFASTGQVITQCLSPCSSSPSLRSHFSLHSRLSAHNVQHCENNQMSTPQPQSPNISIGGNSPCPINAGRHVTWLWADGVLFHLPALCCLIPGREGKGTYGQNTFSSHTAGARNDRSTPSHIWKGPGAKNYPLPVCHAAIMQVENRWSCMSSTGVNESQSIYQFTMASWLNYKVFPTYVNHKNVIM